jgi:hypothetical protein
MTEPSVLIFEEEQETERKNKTILYYKLYVIISLQIKRKSLKLLQNPCLWEILVKVMFEMHSYTTTSLFSS